MIPIGLVRVGRSDLSAQPSPRCPGAESARCRSPILTRTMTRHDTHRKAPRGGGSSRPQSPRASRPRTAPAAPPTRITSAQARHLLMLGQGLLTDPEGPAGPARVLEVVEALGFVQVDSINVLERAHHLTLHARLHEYRHEALRELLEGERRLFEQWTHDASVIPLRWYPHWHPRFKSAATRIRANAWWRQRMGSRPDRVLRQVLDRIERQGPMQSRDFDTSRLRRTAAEASSGKGWWNWSPNKAALEYLWRTGALAIARREGFEKVYDLSERVHPEHHRLAAPDHRTHIDWACRSALERLIVAGPMELAAFWRSVTLAEARRWCEEGVRGGSVEPVEIESVDGTRRSAFAAADWRTRLAEAPDPPGHLRLLSPFDPLIRDRTRTEACFDFRYRFEAFTPAAKRQHGYYVLPLLESDRLVGRLSARHDRNARAIRVEGAWWEDGIRPTRVRRAALDQGLQRLAALVGAASVLCEA